jgi:signal transduction histidine kinase
VKPRHVWTLFALCTAALLAAMAWSSAMVLGLESSQAAARAQAAVEENARLALWRMDSTLAALVAQESARPYFHYRAFYPAANAYTDMFAETVPGQALLPSPLLRETTPYVVLHFQLAPDGTVSSPEIPTGVQRAYALAQRRTTEARLHEGEAHLTDIRGFAQRRAFVNPADENERRLAASRVVTKTAPPQAELPQKDKSANEYAMRQQSYDQQQLANNFSRKLELVSPVEKAVVEVDEGTFVPLWINDHLVLARRVRVGGASYIQGCWIDWPQLRQSLLDQVRDLLPNAALEPDATPSAEHARRLGRAVESYLPVPDEGSERRLASLPVRLIPGAIEPLRSSGVSLVRLSLAGAWLCLALAALAVAALLQGVLSLSERRRVFVSAVTHELRTPLTTFRLYTDMLADGMVGADKRPDYLGKLQREAQRLGHLVENVLFYARLDSGRAGAVREAVDVGDVVRETAARLHDRTEKAGLTVALEAPADGGPLRARTDRSALEQIVVNLIDNACKYAAAGTPPVLHVEWRASGSRALVRVRDHGPGLSTTERRRLFRPFSKSDREAANSAPGVGLGLALSRRLARAQGGDLRLDTAVSEGACTCSASVYDTPRRGVPAGAVFELTLPLA